MTPNFLVAYNVPYLSQVRIYDTSVYDSSTIISSIQAMQLLFATVNSVNNVQTNVTDLVAYKQYVVTSGTVVINGHTYTVGDYIYLVNDTQTAGVNEITETGFFSGIITWVPSSGTYVAFSPSQILYNDSSITYPDNVFTLQYNMFGAKIGASTALMSATQYIVQGTQGDSILLNGETWYVGETFTTNNTNAFTNVTGTNFVCPFVDATAGYFRTWYQNWTIWSNYFNQIATNYQVTQELMARFMAVTARINQCAIYEGQQFGVSLQGINDLITDVNTNYFINP